MNNLITIFLNELNKIDFVAYFLPEIACLLGVVLNLAFFVFLKRKLNSKKTSDILTTGVFAFNISVLFILFIKNLLNSGSLNFTVLNDLFIFNDINLLLKLLINLFMLLFILSVYKIVRKARFKTPVVNSILLLIALFSGIFIQFEGFLGTFLFLEILVFLIYKYASNMRIKKDKIYSVDFILISVCASVLFYAFCFISTTLDNPLQLCIVQVCMTCALFLKAGLFPIYNYTQNRAAKTNIPYSILLFCFLPPLGVIAFSKIIPYFDLNNEIYQLSIVFFASALILSSSIKAFKAKDLIKFFADINYFLCSFCILGILFSASSYLIIKFAFISMFCILGVYSLLCIIKINFKNNKIYSSNLEGMFVNNRLFTFIFCTFLLVLCSVVPSILSLSALRIIKEIYVFDKLSVYPIAAVFLGNILILLNALKLIKKTYTFDRYRIAEFFTKRTVYNYTVPVMILIVLITQIFL